MSLKNDPIEFTAKLWPSPTGTSLGKILEHPYCKLELRKFMWCDTPDYAHHAWDSSPCRICSMSLCASIVVACVEFAPWLAWLEWLWSVAP